MPARRLVAFLTDYGWRDGFVAACHGVLLTTDPDLRILDVSHDVPPFDVRHGAAVLRRIAPYLPPAVYLAVVDPGVGTTRRGIAIQAGESLLVGPDNGLLLPAADALGGVTQAHELTNPDWRLGRVDATFHGRDIFAPAAGRLAAGEPLAAAGTPVAVAELVRLPEPVREFDGGRLHCEVAYVDHYGNVQLAVTRAELVELGMPRLGATVQVGTEGGVPTAQPEHHREHTARVASTFGAVEPGEMICYTDSDERLALAVNSGSAAERLGVRAGSRLVVSAD